MVKLTIIIGTYNRHTLLVRLLKSLLGKVKSSHQIIIMDAGSTDGSIAYIATLGKNVRLIRQKKRIGQAKSLNKILRRIKSQYVCWLSDDNIVLKGVLDDAVSF